MKTDQFRFDFESGKGQAFARSSDPGTSWAAAKSVEGAEATRMELVVLAALKAHPAGLTGHELVEATGLNYESCTPRIRPLVRKGLVVDSGERRTGLSNRKSIVWKAT